MTHSQANNIEVELEYSPKRFRCLVRDNGGGIDPKVLLSGREGHWGLTGMRERAEKVGGHFSVRSSASAGTEVELSVSGPMAFQSQAWDGLLGRLARRFAREASEETESKIGGRR